MKRIVTTFALLAIFAVPAFATTIVSESFTYPNGNLVPNGGWANYSGAGTDIQISAGRASGNHANAPDDHLLFPVQPNTSTTYACFDVIIQPGVVPPPAPKPVYFFELKDAGSSNLVSRVYVLPITGGWTFGISHSSTNATAGVTQWGSATLNYGQKYNIVVNYNPVAKTSTLWVDPINSGSTNVTDTNAAIAALAVQGVGLRQSSAASVFPSSQVYTGTGDILYSVDNIGVGTNFDDSCAQYRSTPTTTSTWGHVKAMYR